MNYYRKDTIEYISNLQSLPGFDSVERFELNQEKLYYLYKDASLEAQGVHVIEDLNFFRDHSETLIGKLSCVKENHDLSTMVKEKRVLGLNLSKCTLDVLKKEKKKSLKVHVLGLGDVGGIMLSGLRLLAGDTISEIGIFDLDEHKVTRWLFELNQIKTIDRGPFPPVKAVDFEDIFDCDVFIFTASTAIPKVGSNVKDVRMYQLEGNSKILSIYAKKAKEKKYKGQFIVVSDPVDLLCKSALISSEGGLLPEQIKGFGLGVMHARASYYANVLGFHNYDLEGRAYGPHGKDLIIADSICNYNHKHSLELTEKTVKANLEVRACGYKPFIAPALSSAALSILAYLEGKDHYSTVYIDGVYFGCKNRCDNLVYVKTEKNDLGDILLDRLMYTYKELKTFEF